MNDWIVKLLNTPDLRRMGHGQRVADLNLGLGWIYYALARALKPRTVVVIGSYRGFVPLIFGKALGDNLEKGIVHFIDPSLVDDFWKDAHAVRAHFVNFGVENIRHHLMTTQQFVASDAGRELRAVDLVFVDGYHTAAQARFDYEAFADRLTPAGMVLFHDSIAVTTSRVYGAEQAYECRVKDFLDELKKDARLQVFDLPFADGVTLVRRGSRE